MLYTSHLVPIGILCTGADLEKLLFYNWQLFVFHFFLATK